MESVSKFSLNDAERDKFIEALTLNLSALRTQAEISHGELANLIGVSRQTYSAIERKVRKMTWSTYLSLVLFFDYNQKTHKMIRMLSIFPRELIVRFNDGVDYSSFEFSSLLGDKSQDIIDHLDQQAFQSIRSMIMVEYARCTQMSSDAVVKSFDGGCVNVDVATERDLKALQAIRAIIADNDKNE